jgi:raffinose/stachyose/melibiose transport system substrate-binding protein
MSIARILKSIFGVLILAVAVWAFWLERPRAGEDSEAMSTAMPVGDPQARFVIDVAPGVYYLPGVIPHGLGEPLHGFRDVAKDFVERFPDTCITFRNVPSGDREWLVTAMSGDEPPDILMINVEEIWVDIQKGWYLALDPYLEKPNPFVPEGEPGSKQWWDMFKYQAITRGKAAPIDQKMYCISLDMVETGIFYNKNEFRRLGIEPPATWAEFMQISQVIKDHGKIPLVTVIDSMSDWGVDILFDQLYADILPGIDLIQDPLREPYLQGYLDWDEIALLHQKGFFTPRDPRYREVFRLMRVWRDYWNKDVGVRTMDRYRPFMRQEGLMLWDGSWLVHRLALSRNLDFDWGVFYLPPITRETSPFAPPEPLPACVIGGSGQQYSVTKRAWSDTGDPATSKRLERVIQFLQFVCLPEHTERIVNESLQFIPNIVGVDPRPEMQPFEEILKRRYTTTKWVATFDLQYNDLLVRMLALYLNDGCTLDHFLKVMDDTLDLAARRAVQRKKLDMNRLERRWEALASVRSDMEGLPDGAR